MPLTEMTDGGGWGTGPSPFWMGPPPPPPYKSEVVKSKDDDDEKKVRRRGYHNVMKHFGLEMSNNHVHFK